MDVSPFVRFIYACTKGDINIIRELWSNGLFERKLVNSLDEKTGKTGLMLASENGYFKIVNNILDYELTDFNITSKTGQTALDLAITGFEAKKREYGAIIELLSEKKRIHEKRLAERRELEPAIYMSTLYTQQNEATQKRLAELVKQGIQVPELERPAAAAAAAAAAAGAAAAGAAAAGAAAAGAAATVGTQGSANGSGGSAQGGRRRTRRKNKKAKRTRRHR